MDSWTKFLSHCAVLSFCLIMATEQARASLILDQSFESAAEQGAQIGLTYDGLAQTFTVGVDGIFDSAELMLKHGTSTPTADLTVSLWDTTAGAPNTSLGSILFSASDISASSYDWVMADFSSLALAVSVGDVLALSISSTDTYSWRAGVDGNATYAGGQRYSDGAGGGVVWSALSNWDFNIRTYVQVPEPGTLALFGIGLVGVGFAARRRRRVARPT